jgi:preprotein translocase subunit YajC
MRSLLQKLFLLPALLLAAAPLRADDLEVVASQGSLWQTLMMVGIAVFFFYFILWRPEKKRRQEMEARRNGLQKGDRVRAMGIVGMVDKINEKTVILKMVDGAKIEFVKEAISEIEGKNQTQEKSTEAPAT